jgi:hypothetical protein
MRPLLLILAVLPLYGRDITELERDLNGIAKVATVMMDGDVCQRIVTERALEHLLRKDPRDKWADADNYDVDDAAFIQTKKTLIRLSRLSDSPVDVNLWMPVEHMPNRVHIVIRNRYEMSLFWKWGELTQNTPAEMKTVLENGTSLTVKRDGGYMAVLAPVRNSMNDVVGLVEVVSRVNPDPRENVQ